MAGDPRKVLKRQATAAAQRVLKALRRGACREASEALGELSALQGSMDRIAWAGKSPRVITRSSLLRVRNAFKAKCWIRVL